MKRSLPAYKQRYTRPRSSARRNARLSPSSDSTCSTPRSSATLLSILKLFALVCLVSLLVTSALFYIVTHRADTRDVNTTSQHGGNPPLPVEVQEDGEEASKRSGPVQGHDGSIILSKMMEGQVGHVVEQAEAERRPAPPGGRDTPFLRHKMAAKSSKPDEKLKEAILKELSPRTRTPEPRDKDRVTVTPTPVPSRSQTPAPQRRAPQTPAPQTPAPQTPAPQTPAPQTPAPLLDTAPTAAASPQTPRVAVPKTRPTPAPHRHHTNNPTPQPPAATPAPAPARKEPPGLPVVRHVSRDPKPPTWQERATLSEIENFIFDTTPIVNFSMDVTEEQIENFDVILPQTIPNYRSPCWLEDVPRDFSYENSIYRCHVNFRRITRSYDFMQSVLLHRQLLGRSWRIRCLPAFYLIGVLKSGTSDMYECLTKHPNIIQPEIKEPEYWSRQRFQISSWLFRKDCIGDRRSITFSEYLDIYDKSSEAIRLSMNKRLDGSLFSDVVFGDFSTHTFVQLVGWDKTLDAPRYISAHHIHQMAPQSKFIIMLRDPVERAYSRYKMRFTRRQNVQGTAAEFHLRMVKEVKDATECMKANSRRYCVYKENFGHEGYHTMLVHGLYVVYLNDWLSIIPRDQFYVVRFEDYIEDRLEFVEDIAYFLGVGPYPETIRREIEKMSPPASATDIGAMLNETRSLLRDFYRPFNHQLADVLHDTRYKWGY